MVLPWEKFTKNIETGSAALREKRRIQVMTNQCLVYLEKKKI